MSINIIFTNNLTKFLVSISSFFVIFLISFPNIAQSQARLHSNEFGTFNVGYHIIIEEAIDLSFSYNRVGSYGIYAGFASDAPLNTDTVDGKSTSYTSFGINYTRTHGDTSVSNYTFHAGVKFANYRNDFNGFNKTVLGDIGYMAHWRDGSIIFSDGSQWGISYGVGLNFGELFIGYVKIGLNFGL